MLNDFSVNQKNLKKRLIPIDYLTRKGVPFEWTEEHQKTFEQIKDTSNLPALVMPNNKEHLTLLSDTSGGAHGAT